MGTRISVRLEALLRRVLAEIPSDARQIDLDLPTTVNPDEHPGFGAEQIFEFEGRELNIFSGHLESEDMLIVQWNEPTKVLEHRRYYVPLEEALGETGHLAYHYARRGGATQAQAAQAAQRSEELPESIGEIHVRLLADGTPWERAVRIAEVVARHHS